MATRPQETPPESIGTRLKKLRLERRLSQRDLSSPGVSYAYISRIEAGARTPSVKALRMLAAKLAVSVEFLETGRDVRESEERELKLIDAELALRLDDDVAAAEEPLREVLADARRAGDAVAESRAAIGLGFAAAQRGSHLDAVEQLEAAVAVRRYEPHVRPDVYATLGQSYAALGAPDRAARLFRECLDAVRDAVPDDHSIRVRFATLLSYALTDAGDYDGAAAAVREGLAAAEATADPYNRIRLYWSIARAAGIDGRFSEALHYIRKAIALLEATNDTTQLARGYLMFAGIESREGHVREAREHVDLADRLLGPAAEARDRAMIQVGRSRIAALERDAGSAVESARAALDILGDFHGGEQGAAMWALARGLALQRDQADAVAAYRRAVDLLVVHGRRHEAAEAAVEWGTFLRECGREAEAEAVLQRAADLGAPEARARRRT